MPKKRIDRSPIKRRSKKILSGLLLKINFEADLKESNVTCSLVSKDVKERTEVPESLILKEFNDAPPEETSK